VLRPLWVWSISTGLRRIDLEIPAKPMSSGEVLDAIAQTQQKSAFLLLDFAPFLPYVVTARRLREWALRQGCAAHTIVRVGAGMDLPKDLAAHALRFSLQLPSAAELDRIVREEALVYSREHAGKRVQIHSRALQAEVRNLNGLAAADARRIARRILADDSRITEEDQPAVAKAKFELPNKAGMSSFEYEPISFAEVAGARRLQRWIQQRRAVLIGEPTSVPLDPPKGILLLGVQGTGKSLAAKAVAGDFQVPLLRLDLASVYYHGETERNLRESLQSAELMAPCVLWVDEIEKGFASSDSDGGVSRRVLGYFLTWMAERKSRTFLVATANAIDQLPPELLRKGPAHRRAPLFDAGRVRAARRRVRTAAAVSWRSASPWCVLACSAAMGDPAVSGGRDGRLGVAGCAGGGADAADVRAVA
jgi:hypothetical protein